MILKLALSKKISCHIDQHSFPYCRIAGLDIASSQVLAFVFIFLIGLGFANIFPLIFSMTVDAMPKRSNDILGPTVTAIIGEELYPSLLVWWPRWPV